MTQQENDNDLKIKQRFLLKIDSRSEEQKKKFTKWINAQRNPQDSVVAMINHMIDRFGYQDITDHEVARKLYTEILNFGEYEKTPSNQRQSAVETVASSPVKRDSAAIPEKRVKNPLEQPIIDAKIDPDAF